MMAQTSSFTVQECVRALNQHASGTWQDEELAEAWGENQDQFVDVLTSETVNVWDDLEDAGLSTREALVVLYKSLGLTYPAIAWLCNINESTVGEYVRRARAKRDEAERLLESLDVHGIDL